MSDFGDFGLTHF